MQSRSAITRRTRFALAKEYGLSDRRLSFLTGASELEVRDHRKSHRVIVPVYKRVDTCGAEFESFTPYLYSTYEEECEADPTDRRKIMILGSGPNRIGQGIEFDYCCCHASFALRDADFETIMVNCNPETVSTDYDTSDRLYFEPLTFEDVMNIVDVEKPDGVIVQFGGQTPLNLADRLHAAGVPIIGTSPDSIDLAEDRKRFGALLERVKNSTAPKRHSGFARGSKSDCRQDRLSDRRAAEFCAGRACDGDRLRRAIAGRIYAYRRSMLHRRNRS